MFVFLYVSKGKVKKSIGSCHTFLFLYLYEIFFSFAVFVRY